MMKLCHLVCATGLALAGAATSISAAEALAADAQLLVEVADPSTGRPVTTARYIAVVGVERPWREPSAEAVVPAGEPAPVFTVPPGQYRVVCGAAGLGLRFEPPTRLESGQNAALQCQPATLASVRGRLVSADSRAPVAGALVAPRVLFEEESPLRLSATGMAFAVESFSARTDAAGFFEVSGERSASTELWVEAEGFASRSLGVVEFMEPAPDLGEIRLHPGGTLTISVRPSAGFPRDDYLIAIRPPSAVLDRSQETTRYETLMRPLSDSGPIRYPGLAPGHYQVWLKPRVRSGRSAPPQTLGTVDVHQGEVTSLEVVLPEPDLARDDSTSEITLFSPNLTSTSVRELKVRLWRDGHSEDVAVVAQDVSGGLRVRLATNCSDLRRVQVLADGLITPAVAIPPSVCVTAPVIEIEMLPAARLRGSVEVPMGFRKPEMAEFVVAACDAVSQATDLPAFPFSIAREGHWIATVPAECVELSLVAAGFAPREVGEFQLEPLEERQMGVQRLIPGAVLLVHCVDGSDGLPAARIAIDVVSQEDSAVAIAASFRRQDIPSVVRATTNDQGWVRFDGLPEATYRIRAIGEGGTVTFSPPFALEAAVESVVEVEIPPPSAVEVAVEGGGLVAAEAERLAVLATGAGDCDWLADALIEQPVEVPGRTLFEGLPPGRWSFTLHLRGPGGTFQLAEESIEVPPGGLSHITLKAAGHVFTGEVTWLGEPVEAAFRLRSRADGDIGRTVAAARSREDGEFRLVLTEPGTYDVEIRIEGEGASIVPEVSFEDPDEWIEVELGGGAIEGTIVDGDGRPVGGGAIHARKVSDSREPIQEVSRRAGKDGSFRIERLTAGRWQLRATAENRQSDTEEIQLEDQELRAGVVLTVENATLLRGRVSVDGQPLAGAAGWVTCLWTSLQDLCGGVFRTDARGEFEMPLGDAPEGAQVNVLIEGAAPLDAFREQVARRDVDLSINAVGGRVTLSSQHGSLSTQRVARMLLVNERGGVVPAVRGILVEPESPEDAGAVLFPVLAPGTWRLFEASNAVELELLLRTAGSGASARAAFEVAPGTSTEIPLRD